MPFKVKYDDITTYDVEVVVNSLGTEGKVYGKLCKNIIPPSLHNIVLSYIFSYLKIFIIVLVVIK